MEKSIFNIKYAYLIEDEDEYECYSSEVTDKIRIVAETFEVAYTIFKLKLKDYDELTLISVKREKVKVTT